MVLAIFKTEENCPLEKDISKTSLHYQEMPFFSSFKLSSGLLLGPDDFCQSKEDIIKHISFLSVGVKKGICVCIR